MSKNKFYLQTGVEKADSCFIIMNHDSFSTGGVGELGMIILNLV